ncbi:hypothetical protein I7I51_08841 [Histoplasma capsulatum]|uniref:Uncharacterized protein n=1 Tax=Ajellomyces capsulatus TaxID=5037 RepID=A0A8A1LYY3_AJECA|nr:hypothetical protein I7I51_08841 [Histoplasma capsulatum]
MSIFKSISRATMIGSLAALSCAPAIRRRLSIVSIHSIFPATLYRFQLQRESGLYDKRLQAYDAEVEDALEIADDGMVYPGITNTALNKNLTEFYSKYGIVTAAGEWMERNPYSEAFDDNSTDWIHR